MVMVMPIDRELLPRLVHAVVPGGRGQLREKY